MEHELVYPIAPDYVRSWDVVRAIAELVANAFDEDPACKVTYKDGTLTITDRGDGWTDETLIIGHSTKTDQQIGQFGEGVKLALLVLARERRDVTIHTAGQRVTASIDRRRVGWGPDDRTHELLVVRSRQDRRRRGTRIDVAVDAAEASAVRRRFLRLSQPRYRTPSAGRILTDRPGDVYVGGVRVVTGRDLLLGYDLPLDQAKTLINRDRDMIDGWELGQRLGAVIAATSDTPAIELYIRAALTGTLGRQEQQITGRLTRNSTTDATWRRIARRVLNEGLPALPLPAAARNGNLQYYWDETAETRDIHYALKDRGWVRIPPAISGDAHHELMTKIGVPHVDSVALERERVTWVGNAGLTPTERRNLSLALRRCRRHFGDLPRIRIYTRHENGDTLGFFDSSRVRIGIRRDQLADLETLALTLVHELAHWQAWRSGRDWHDRTRDFELTLSEIAATLITTPPRTGTRVRVPEHVPVAD